MGGEGAEHKYTIFLLLYTIIHYNIEIIIFPENGAAIRRRVFLLFL